MSKPMILDCPPEAHQHDAEMNHTMSCLREATGCWREATPEEMFAELFRQGEIMVEFHDDRMKWMTVQIDAIPQKKIDRWLGVSDE